MENINLKHLTMDNIENISIAHRGFGKGMGNFWVKKSSISLTLVKITVAAFVIAVLAGCGPQKEEKTIEKVNEVVQQEENLYGRFLKGEVAATTGENYLADPESYPLEKGRSYTLEELGWHINSNYLNPEYRFDKGRTSYDEIQYAYMECLDSEGKNLLIKFKGLDIYSENDDSYTVMVVAEDGNRLYITYQYDCWDRSEKCAYKRGQIVGSGSSGAGAHGSNLSVILSNGKCVQIFERQALDGEWISYVNNKIYNEVFDGSLELASDSDWAIYITTVGDEKYYQYDIEDCSEEEKALCENYIDRCHEEASINWTTDAAVLEAIKNRCAELGFDYEETEELVEVEWISN